MVFWPIKIFLILRPYLVVTEAAGKARNYEEVALVVSVNLAMNDSRSTQRETWENGLLWVRLLLRFGSIIQSCCCSVTKWYTTLCDHMDCSTSGFPIIHHLPELAQTLVHWVSDAIQPSHPLSSPSPPAFNLSQHQGFFQWVSCSHHVAKVLEFQHQSFQWIFRTDLL